MIWAADQPGVLRLAWFAAFAVGDTFAVASLSQRVLYRTVMRDLYANKDAFEN
jgi:hypothetical protein